MDIETVGVYPDLVVALKPNVRSIESLSVLTYSGVITGKILEQGVPVSRRVLCHQRDTGVLAGRKW